jgi:ubiquinone/menaquinone biosynthesis C-methylase UbiE
MESSYAPFARTYDLEYGKLETDLPFYTDLARETGGPVLEMAVGTGRVAIPIAREGLRVFGIDSCPEMLTVLAKKLENEPGLPITWVEADMRDFDLSEMGPFKLITCPARAFLHMVTVEDQLAALSCVRRHLDDDGIFAGNMFFPGLEIIRRGFRGPHSWVYGDEYVDPDTGLRVVISHMNRHDPRTQFIRAQFRHEHMSESGEVVKTEVHTLEMSWIWPRELEHLFARAGLRIETLYGDFDRTPFPEASNEMLWVARKTG